MSPLPAVRTKIAPSLVPGGGRPGTYRLLLRTWPEKNLARGVDGSVKGGRGVSEVGGELSGVSSLWVRGQEHYFCLHHPFIASTKIGTKLAKNRGL